MGLKKNFEESAGEESNDMNRAFSELSSYCSGTSELSSEYTSGDTGSTGESSFSKDGSLEKIDESSTDDSEYETDESSKTSLSSPHSSDTSYGLSTLIETSDGEELEKFVRLRPEDRRWIEAAWKYFDEEPTYHRKPKPVKVVRKMRMNAKNRGNWTELQHEYNLRHPLCADGKTMEELKRLTLHARHMPLPDLNV